MQILHSMLGISLGHRGVKTMFVRRSALTELSLSQWCSVLPHDHEAPKEYCRKIA